MMIENIYINMTSEDNSEDEFREEITKFLRRNFPQIQMHGGDSSILDADPDEGYVRIALGGACSGCGISPMTVQAIKSRMPNQIESVTRVEVSTGMDEGAGFGSGATVNTPTQNQDNNEDYDAPF